MPYESKSKQVQRNDHGKKYYKFRLSFNYKNNNTAAAENNSNYNVAASFFFQLMQFFGPLKHTNGHTIMHIIMQQSYNGSRNDEGIIII